MALQSHLYLTGFRGTGKSSVADQLAKRLDRIVVDLDERIEQRAGMTIREIFDRGGESAFRDLETDALFDLQDEPALIVSLGGGAVLRKRNRQRIRETGTCVWLDADASTIARRLRTDETTTDRRPALTSMSEVDEIQHLLSERRSLYEQVSDHRIATSELSVQEVVEKIIAWLS